MTCGRSVPKVNNNNISISFLQKFQMRNYSLRNTMEEIEHRVLKVVSAYDKVTADKVNKSLQESTNLALFLLFFRTAEVAGKRNGCAVTRRNRHCH